MCTYLLCVLSLVITFLAYACLGQVEFTGQNSTSDITTRSCSKDDDCPLWMKCTPSKYCKCSKTFLIHALLKCDENGLSVLDCYCMTNDNRTDQLKVGVCIENCRSVKRKDQLIHHAVYHPVFNEVDNINEVMCKNRFNRKGQLCGKCLSTHRPQAYSFNLTCIECHDGNNNLWKYFLVALLPLTFFYFFVLLFKVNTTSSHLHGYVLFAQAVSVPSLAQVLLISLESKPELLLPLRILYSLFGFWNLEFFRVFELGICLDMSPLAVRALDYTIAAYPFFLSVISYVLIDLYDRNFRVLVFLWKPFRCFFSLFRRNWDTRTSVIDAYATLYLLSFYKIISVSFDLLVPATLHSVKRMKEVNVHLVLFYDGTVSYFGKEHLPYAILALIVTTVFVMIPMLWLLIYRLRCFQKLANYCNIHSHILNALMDSFQGCYKDGTEPGIRDCRWFAGLDLFVRVVVYSIMSFLYFPFAALVLILVLIVFVNVQPYKTRNAHYNKIDITFYCLLAFFYTSLESANIASIKAFSFTNASYILAVLIAITPLLYMACLSIHWMFSRRKWGKTLVNYLKAWRRGYSIIQDSLPDRIEHPRRYPVEQGLEDTADLEGSEVRGGVGHMYTN